MCTLLTTSYCDKINTINMEGVKVMKDYYVKKVFSDALLQCLKTTPLDDVRTSEICERCGLSKKTFYRHFKDKYELAVYLYNEMSTSLLTQNSNRSYYEIVAEGDEDRNDVIKRNEADTKRMREYWFSGENKAIAFNLFCSSRDVNSPYHYNRTVSIQGRKNIILARLKAKSESLYLPEETLDLSAELLFEVAEFFHEKWNPLLNKDSYHSPFIEEAYLVDIQNLIIDYFVSIAKEKT